MQNGCAEREMRTIVESARSMIHSKCLDYKFWAEAVNCAVNILNRTGPSPIAGKSPYELLFIYRIWCHESHKIELSPDVIFEEESAADSSNPSTVSLQLFPDDHHEDPVEGINDESIYDEDDVFTDAEEESNDIPVIESSDSPVMESIDIRDRLRSTTRNNPAQASSQCSILDDGVAFIAESNQSNRKTEFSGRAQWKTRWSHGVKTRLGHWLTDQTTGKSSTTGGYVV